MSWMKADDINNGIVLINLDKITRIKVYENPIPNKNGFCVALESNRNTQCEILFDTKQKAERELIRIYNAI